MYTPQFSLSVPTPGNTYDFKVTATNDAGTSVYSGVLQVKAAD